MRIILRIRNGQREGHQIVLLDRQTLNVGRSALCELSFELDGMMSGTHFSLTTEGETCRLRDENSTNGTYVNGERVNETFVIHKDQILAGQTKFAIDVEPSSGGKALKKTISADHSSIGLLPTSYFTHTEVSGIRRLSGLTDRSLPSNVARILSKHFEQLAIISIALVPENHRTAIPTGEPLFDWLPEESQNQSPRILSDPDDLKRAPIIDLVWGNDALVLVYSPKGEPPPIDHLRQSAAAFARPSLLRPQVSDTDPAYASNLLGEVTAVFMEMPDGKQWSLFSTDDLSGILDEAGMFPSNS